MPETINHPFAQTATVKEIKNDHAVIVLADGQILTWAVSLLPPNTKTGDNVRVIIHNQETDEQERQRLSRQIINELLDEDQKKS